MIIFWASVHIFGPDFNYNASSRSFLLLFYSCYIRTLSVTRTPHSCWRVNYNEDVTLESKVTSTKICLTARNVNVFIFGPRVNDI